MADPIIGKISVGDGATFTPAVDNDGVISWSNNKNLPNPASVDIPQAVMDRYQIAPIASPAFTGTPTAPTPASSDNSTKIATTEFVNAKAGNYLPLSGGTLTGDVDITGDLSVSGTMTGSIQYVDNGKVFSIENTGIGAVDLGWSYDNREGAGLELRSTDHSNPGEFVLFARGANNTCYLTGMPDGSLTWNGQPLLPVGVVQAFAGTTIPNGWLLCDGSAVSRTTYASLYACIGTTYGSGNGSTTFNLPNLVDKFVEGSATAGTVKSAGLPNITGYFTSDGISANVGGAFAFSDSKNGAASNNSGYWREGTIDFYASASNSIYGNSSTVQPPALTMRYIIKY